MYLEPLEDNDHKFLYDEIKKLRLIHNGGRQKTNKKGTAPYSNSWGLCRPQNRTFSRGEEPEFPSWHTSRLKADYPHLGDVFKKISKKYFPNTFYYNSVNINRNFECLPHIDKYNIGPSIIIGLGEYSGGELVIGDIDYNIKNKVLFFNGKNEHYVKPFEGLRYSLVFFNCFDFNYRIAIPSFRRPNLFKEHTYKYLNDCNIDLKKVDLFLHDDVDYMIYKKYLDPKINIIRHGQKGIGAVRNYIQSYYHENLGGTDTKHIFSIDDDIKTLQIKDRGEQKNIKKLDWYIQSCFGICKDNGSKLWGVSPYNNIYFLHEKTSCSLHYIPGGSFGFIVDKEEPVIHTAYDHLEDFSFSCEHFLRYNKVVRFNNISMDTKFFNKGGICEYYGGKKARQDLTGDLCYEFKGQYEDMCKIKKKPEYYSIVLNSYFKN